VIPMSTEIVAGHNFFGHPLSGLDHAYDPTQFATKIRSVGVWFTGYDSAGLSLTPRVYLVPAGTDIQLVPDSPDLEQREWNVIDQKIPVPYPITAGDLKKPDWIVSTDSLNGSPAEIQKYSEMRAFPDFLSGDQYVEERGVTRDTRLIGRSVWNTKWVLIIPGQMLSADPNDGLDRFVGSDTESGITDINLVFETYAHPGK